nr:hypothetical protein [Bradyrhizobium sp. 186]
MKQNRSLEERLGEQATQLKEQAAQLPAGAERERLLRKARLAETGAHLSDWLTCPVCNPRSKPLEREPAHRQTRVGPWAVPG